MNPRDFLRLFCLDERLATGAYFTSEVQAVTRGDHVGVVLLGLGGPRERSELEAFLYSRWMDPVLYSGGLRYGRHQLASVASRLAAGFFWREYEQIGGECAANRLMKEQASTLETSLREHLGPSTRARFSAYVAMRYGLPSGEDALLRMLKDGVTKAVLLPTHPQYSIATTGTSLAYLAALVSSVRRSTLSVSAVVEYAAHPKYLQAVSERIDQALQRFPKHVRQDVEIVFCAKHPGVRGEMGRQDSFCDLAQVTVDRLAALRGIQSPQTVACFSSGIRKARPDGRDMREVLRAMVDRKIEAVLVVPLGLTTDHVWTTYTLDIFLRQVAAGLGIKFFEVASGLNCHPLLISALVDIVGSHLTSVSPEVPRTQRSAVPDTGTSTAIPRATPQRSTGCPDCRGPVRARDWGPTPHPGAASL